MDYVERCVRNNRGVDTMETYRQTGFNETEQGQLLVRLVQKGFIIPEDCNPPKITTKWAGAFTDIEKEFEELFWRRNGKVFFTGSKKAALKFYVALRKKYSREFVLGQKEAYAQYLDMEHKRGFDRAVMMAERWLNPINEYYMSDWKSMAEDIQKKITNGQIKLEKNTQPMTKTEIVTAEQRKQEYEQDSNQ